MLPETMLRPRPMAPMPKIMKLGLLTLLGPVVVVSGASALISWRSRGRIYEEISEIPSHRVGIILGASVFSNGEPSLTLAHRLRAGLELYREKKVKQLIVSGDHGEASYDEPNVMRRWLMDHGIPSEAIFVDHAGFRTLDSMARARLVFGVDGAVICTQAFHLPRAIFLARHWKIDAVGLSAEAYAPHRRINFLRETLAKTRAVIDVYLLGTQPRYGGPPIPLDGPSSRTHG